LHDLLAAAAQLGQVQLALVLAEFAVAALLDAVGQILRDLLLEAAQQQRPQLGGERRRAMRWRCDFGALAALGS
jgi:hypothetical protein